MKQTWSWIAAAGGIALIIWMTIALICGLAPFGLNSIAFEGLNPGFLSLLPDLQQFFTGPLSPFSLLNFPLAGNALALFAFYLFSPFNSLFLFLSRSLFPLMLNWSAGLKMIAASLCFYWMLFRMFPGMKESWPKKTLGLVMSLAYGMGPSALLASEAVFWLDGMILTPLITNSIYWLIRQGRISVPLAVWFSLLLCINWYQALGIGFYGLIFLFLQIINADLQEELEYSFSRICLCYLGSIILAVMAGAVLIFPVFSSLRQGLSQQIYFGLNQTFLETLKTGFISVNLSLFWLPAGIIGWLGAFLSLFKGCFSMKEKLIHLILIVWGLSWLVLPAVPALQMPGIQADPQRAFSFLCAFSLLFLAAKSLLGPEGFKWTGLAASLVCTLLVLVVFCGFLYPAAIGTEQIVLFGIETAFVLVLVLSLVEQIHLWKGWSVLLAFCLCAELLWSGHTLLRLDANSTLLSQYQNRLDQQKQLQLSAGNQNFFSLISDSGQPQMEALGINNQSLLFQSNGMYLLSHLGLVNIESSSSQLQADSLPALSLLGASVILSDRELDGYSLVEESSDYYLYENPYVLPEAVLYPSGQDLVLTTDPFENQNRLYSLLAGQSISMYDQIEGTLAGNNASEISYELVLPKGNYLYYGYLPGQKEQAFLYINGEFAGLDQGARIFSISQSSGGTVSITLRGNGLTDADEARFAALDLDIFSQAVEEIKDHTVDSIRSRNYLSVQNIHGNPDESLFTRLLDSSNLEIELSEPSPLSLIDGALVNLKSIEKNSSVLFYYFLPSLYIGQWTSLAGLVLIAFFAFNHWRIRKRSRKEKTEKEIPSGPDLEPAQPVTELPPNLPPLPVSEKPEGVTGASSISEVEPGSEFFEDYQNEQSPLFDVTFENEPKR